VSYRFFIDLETGNWEWFYEDGSAEKRKRRGEMEILP
jgi:hypothetical protein